MGKATRWLKALLGMKKRKDKNDSVSSHTPKDKKRWSFAGKPSKPLSSAANPKAPATLSISDSAWLRSYRLAETEAEQSKHAIAVAAATAAAADAAVAAAQAAVAVVRLTSQGSIALNGKRERWAAAKIQSVFRGYLARKALRALRGLVKIQALVRGYLVRKRAAATLHSMQALIRAQTAVRTQRARRSFNKENRLESEFHSKRVLQEEVSSPKIVEMDTCSRPRTSRSRRFAEYDAFHHYNYNYNHNHNHNHNNYESAVSSPLEWCFHGHECKLPTSHNTPRLFGGGANTPSKSLCGELRLSQCSESPSYMANTQSFSAKLRSHSAPRQRPEPGSGPAIKKRLSLTEILAARNSISSVRMHKSYAHFQHQDFLNY